jgi:hypothetical protein
MAGSTYADYVAVRKLDDRRTAGHGSGGGTGGGTAG